MALNDTSSLALLASFPDLPSQERERVETGLSANGRKIAAEIRRLQENNGFSLPQASSPAQVAKLYLDWAQGATARTPAKRQVAYKKRRVAKR